MTVIKQTDTRIFTFVLVGPYADKTVFLHGYNFTNGECNVTVNAANHMSVINHMSRNCQAFLKGSDELINKQRWYKEVCLKEARPDGKHNVSTSSDGNKADQVQDEVRQTGTELAKEVATDSGTAADSETGDSGVRTSRDRPADAGNSEQSEKLNQTIKTTVLNLDVNNDDHWTKTGLPDVNVIRDKLDDAGIKREDIEAVLPKYNRVSAGYNP